ncbi:MAG: hypothetical protein ACE5Q6_24055 [Dehalococcoidia bacterium]
MDRPIFGGLRVTAQRLSDDRTRRFGRRVTGRPTPSGVIAFFGLAVEEYVDHEPDRQIWTTVPANRLIAVDVADTLGRYLPMSFVARLPFRGAFRGRGDWLTPLLRPVPEQGNEMGVDLWSAPTRPVPDGRALIRAQIVVGNSSAPPPAAHALVQVTHPGGGPPPAPLFERFGITDSQGVLTLPFPYPPVPDPPDTIYPPLDSQEFQLTIAVHYDSTSQRTLPDSTVPDLETILNQPAADIGTHWNTDDPPELETAATVSRNLRFGRPLTLRTAIGNPDAAETESVLRIQPN